MSQQPQQRPQRRQAQQPQRQQQKRRPAASRQHQQPDPLSVLVSATELKLWREDETTQKILRYLDAWRERTKEALAEGTYLLPSAEASAMKSTEAVAKCQMIADLLDLKAGDIAAFYGFPEPDIEKKEGAKK